MRIIELPEIRRSLVYEEVIARMRDALIANSRGECDTPMPMHLDIATEKTELNEPYYTKTWQIDGGTYEFGLREVTRPAARKLPTNKTAKKA